MQSKKTKSRNKHSHNPTQLKLILLHIPNTSQSRTDFCSFMSHSKSFETLVVYVQKAHVYTFKCTLQKQKNSKNTEQVHATREIIFSNIFASNFPNKTPQPLTQTTRSPFLVTLQHTTKRLFCQRFFKLKNRFLKNQRKSIIFFYLKNDEISLD